MQLQSKHIAVRGLRTVSQCSISRQGELQERTNPWASVERKVLPTGPEVLPPLRLKLIRILAIQVLATMQRIRMIHHNCAFGDKQRRILVRPATKRQNGVPDAEARIARHDGVHAQALVEAVLEVLHVAQLLVGGEVAVERVLDLAAQLVEDVGPLGDDEPHVAEQRGGGVAAGEQHVEQLVAQPPLVLGRLGQLLQEHVLLVHLGARLLLHVDLLPVPHRLVDELVHVLVADADGLHALFVLVETAQEAQARAHGNRILRLVERLGERGFGGPARGRGAQAINALTKEELGRRVDGEAEEQLLEVDGAAVAREHLEQGLDVALEGLEVGDLVSSEVWPDHGARVGPGFAVAVEDAVAQQRTEGVVAVAQAVVFELEREDRLNVLRVACHDDLLEK